MAQLPSKLRFAFTPSGGYKAGALYPVVPNDNVGNFDVSRTGVATRVNKHGLIELVNENVPRLDYSDGGCPKLLTEKGSTNQFFNSVDFTQSNWAVTNASITTSSEPSPDGNSSFKMNDNSTNGVHLLNGNPIVFPNGASFSVFAKAGEYRNFAIANLSSLKYIKFDLSEGVVISVGSGWSNAMIEYFGNGWYRCSGRTISNSTCGYGLIDDNLNSSFSGNGTKGVYIWGAQSEDALDFPTSYIPTNTNSAVSRAPDNVTGGGDSSTFNSQSGVLFADIKGDLSSFNRQIEIKNSSNSYISLRLQSSTAVTAVLVDNGSQRIYATVSSVSTTLQNKLALCYNSSGISIVINGVVYKFGGDWSFPNGTYNELTFSDNLKFYGKTKSIQHYDSLSDLELEQLTGYDSYSAMTSQFNFNVL